MACLEIVCWHADMDQWSAAARTSGEAGTSRPASPDNACAGGAKQRTTVNAAWRVRCRAWHARLRCANGSYKLSTAPQQRSGAKQAVREVILWTRAKFRSCMVPQAQTCTQGKLEVCICNQAAADPSICCSGKLDPCVPVKFQCSVAGHSLLAGTRQSLPQQAGRSGPKRRQHTIRA